MVLLILGLVIFFASHALPMEQGIRTRLVNQFGENTYKGLFTLVSLVGLILIIWGYSLARQEPTVIYDPPSWFRYITVLLMLPVFIMFLSTYLPGRIKATLKHPMILSIKLWALAHLFANGTLADLLLFGCFLIWAVGDLMSVKRRGATGPVAQMEGPPRNDLIAIIGGLVLYVIFVFGVHQWLTGLPIIP